MLVFRGQECVHFILSKPVEQFSGSIRTALQHYQTTLHQKMNDEADETDLSSPMERRLLQWFYSTQFFQNNGDSIEIRPQFPIGDYLKQLDPLYRHPAYRSNLLLMFREEQKTINVVIEYDGFREHFLENGRIYDPNWAFYYRPGDIEKQMVLESYGYKFLRVNRFNLGADPVATLSERLYALVDAVKTENVPHDITTKVQMDAEGLRSGEIKYCQKCKLSKPIAAFYNPSLTTKYGRFCVECQTAGKKKAASFTPQPIVGADSVPPAIAPTDSPAGIVGVDCIDPQENPGGYNPPLQDQVEQFLSAPALLEAVEQLANAPVNPDVSSQ